MVAEGCAAAPARWTAVSVGETSLIQEPAAARAAIASACATGSVSFTDAGGQAVTLKCEPLPALMWTPMRP